MELLDYQMRFGGSNDAVIAVVIKETNSRYRHIVDRRSSSRVITVAVLSPRILIGRDANVLSSQ